MNFQAKASLGFVLLAIALVVVVFMLGALVLQALVNVVLGQYHAELLTYGSALAVMGLLWLFGGGISLLKNGKD